MLCSYQQSVLYVNDHPTVARLCRIMYRPAVVEGAFSCRLAPPGKGAAPVGVEDEGGGPLLATAGAGWGWVAAGGPTTGANENAAVLTGAAAPGAAAGASSAGA